MKLFKLLHVAPFICVLILLVLLKAGATEPEPIIHGFSEGLGPVRVDGKWGYIDVTGQMVIKPQFDLATQFKNGLGFVQLDGKIFYIDRKGIRKSREFDGTACIPDTPDGLCSFWAKRGTEARWGYLKKGFEVAIAPQFEWAGRFVDGLAPVTVGKYPNSKTGYINTQGKFLIQPRFEFGKPFSEGLANVVADGRHFFINTKGVNAFDKEFRFAFEFNDGLACVNTHFERNYNPQRYNFVTDGKYGFIDKKGNWVIAPKYQMAGQFIEERAIVKLHEKFGLINKKGDFVVAANYYNIDYVGNGYWRAEDSNVNRFGRRKSRLLNKDGKIVSTRIVDRCQVMNGGLCSFYDNESGKMGFINTRDEIVIPPTYDATWGFSEDIAAVKRDGKWGYINKGGKFIWKPTK